MNRLQILLLSLPILGIFLPVMTCQAKVEQTTGFTLIDMGHGSISRQALACCMRTVPLRTYPK